jgi:hypothetical protein
MLLQDTMKVVSYLRPDAAATAASLEAAVAAAFLRPKTILKELTKNHDGFENLY